MLNGNEKCAVQHRAPSPLKMTSRQHKERTTGAHRLRCSHLCADPLITGPLITGRLYGRHINSQTIIRYSSQGCQHTALPEILPYLVHSAIHSAPLLSAQPNTHIRAPANTQKICQCRARLYVPWILRNGVRPNKNSPATTHKICQHRLSKLSHCILSLTKKAALYTESDHIQN